MLSLVSISTELLGVARQRREFGTKIAPLHRIQPSPPLSEETLEVRALQKVPRVP